VNQNFKQVILDVAKINLNLDLPVFKSSFLKSSLQIHFIFII